MVDHLEVMEYETAIFIEDISANRSKVERWDPDLVSHDKHIDDTTLNVADQDQEKDHIDPFQLALDICRRIQICNQSAQSADTQ